MDIDEHIHFEREKEQKWLVESKMCHHTNAGQELQEQAQNKEVIKGM